VSSTRSTYQKIAVFSLVATAELASCKSAKRHADESGATAGGASDGAAVVALVAGADPVGVDAGPNNAAPTGDTTLDGRFPDGAERVFTGTMGKSVKIVARLTRAADQLSGRYFYERKGIDLELRGSLTSAGLSLDEVGMGAKKSGHLAGAIDDAGNIDGTWTDARGKHPLPFHLAYAPPAWTPSRPLRLYKKRAHFSQRPKIKEPDALLKACTLDAEYPEIDGSLEPAAEAKANASLRPKSATPDATCETAEENDVKYEVSLNQSGVLSVVFDTSWCCGAHPSYSRQFVNLAVETGSSITLSRLLAPGARAKLVGFLLPLVQRTAHEIELDQTTELLKQLTEDPAEFSVERGGLRFSAFNSQPHVIQSAFAEGYFLPFARLAPLLREPSPLAALLRD
jgi:hypothetical protein